MQGEGLTFPIELIDESILAGDGLIKRLSLHQAFHFRHNLSRRHASACWRQKRRCIGTARTGQAWLGRQEHRNRRQAEGAGEVGEAGIGTDHQRRAAEDGGDVGQR